MCNLPQPRQESLTIVLLALADLLGTREASPTNALRLNAEHKLSKQNSQNLFRA